MRTSIPTLFALAIGGSLFAAAPAQAWPDQCKVKAERAAGVEAKGVEKVQLRIGAGELKVVGVKNATRIEARGVACAPKQESLDKAQLSVRREGNVVIVETDLPQYEGGWADGDDNAYIDVGIAVPANVPVEAIDSSGDAIFEGLQALKLEDSSGDLRVSNIAEHADVGDSSGDLVIVDVGSLKLRDSSGDIEVRDVRGGVEVTSDSSGEMSIAHVGGDVVVHQDSSGEIRIEDVRGNAVVHSDSSGGIYAGRVSGDFTVGSDGSGTIEHESIGGRVTTPSN